jgi:hypothetical protein
MTKAAVRGENGDILSFGLRHSFGIWHSDFVFSSSVLFDPAPERFRSYLQPCLPA